MTCTDAMADSPGAYDTPADTAELAKSLAVLEESMEDTREDRTRPAKPALERIPDPSPRATSRCPQT